MATRSNRWVLLWALVMLLAFAGGGLYVRANLPSLPGVYWLAPYPTEGSVSDLQREAESAPAYQQALNRGTVNRARDGVLIPRDFPGGACESPRFFHSFLSLVS
jgi:hypothetical protein